jgi:thioredoxin-like negative regulator of GroEL
MSQTIAEVDDSNFKQIVLEAKRPVLVEFCSATARRKIV